MSAYLLLSEAADGGGSPAIEAIRLEPAHWFVSSAR